MGILRTTVFLVILSVSLTLAACENPGPAEQAGKNIDGAFDAVKKKAKEMTE